MKEIEPNYLIPLKSMSLNILVENELAFVNFTQNYFNNEMSPIECEYSISLPKSGIIENLSVSFESGAYLTAKIEEIESAKETYADQVSAGNTSILANSGNNKNLDFFIGNLLPSSTVSIKLEFCFPINSNQNVSTVTFPVEFLNIFIRPENLPRIDLSVEIISRTQIIEYDSNYPINWVLVMENKKLMGNINPLVKFYENELKITFKSLEEFNNECVLHPCINNPSKYFAMLSFLPFSSQNFTEDYGSSEFILLLDRSGSMQGEKMKLAKNALIIFLKSLPKSSIFNVISFGSKFKALFEISVSTNSENLEKAIEKIQGFKANLGGTDIFSPVSQILSMDVKAGYSKSLFIITDGEDNNKKEIVKLIKSQNSQCRVHGFGIGSDCDQDLISKVARAGKGSANFVKNVQELGNTVVVALQKALLPCITDWQVDLPGEKYPEDNKLGFKYYGEKFLQFILLENIPNLPIIVKGINNLTGKFENFEIANMKIIQNSQIFSKFWASLKIKSLSSNEQKNPSEIIQLSKQFGVISKLTSYVLVRENLEKANEEVKKIEIKKRKSKKSITSRSNYRGRSQNNRGLGRGCRTEESSVRCLSKVFYVEPQKRTLKKCKRSRSRSIENKTDDNNYINLVTIQSIDGFWDYNKISITVKDIHQICGHLKGDKNIIATVFAISYFEKFFKEKLNELKLIIQKAEKWLRETGQEFESIRTEINALLGI